jgi:RHS repeat-associated protein
VSDGSGTVVWRWDQTEPFGDAPPNDNPSGQGAFEFPLRFPGQYFDSETRLSYNYFRTYDAAIGRYTRSDPIGLWAGINTYIYGGANPLLYSDPRGLAPKPGGKRRYLPYPQPPVPYPWSKPKPAEDEMEGVPGSRERPESRPDREQEQRRQCMEREEKKCDAQYDRDKDYCSALAAVSGNQYDYVACMRDYARPRYLECLKECEKTCK